MLYIFSGLPGVGKSTLAKHLAQKIHAVYLRIDTIEQSLRNYSPHYGKQSVIYDEGYQIGFATALENLKLGNIVVADSTNPVAESRNAWHRIAKLAETDFRDIEVICSDENEHRMRVEERKSDIQSLRLPDWQSVKTREYHVWTVNREVIDTAGKSIDESEIELLELLEVN